MPYEKKNSERLPQYAQQVKGYILATYRKYHRSGFLDDDFEIALITDYKTIDALKKNATVFAQRVRESENQPEVGVILGRSYYGFTFYKPSFSDKVPSVRFAFGFKPKVDAPNWSGLAFTLFEVASRMLWHINDISYGSDSYYEGLKKWDADRKAKWNSNAQAQAQANEESLPAGTGGSAVQDDSTEIPF